MAKKAAPRAAADERAAANDQAAPATAGAGHDGSGPQIPAPRGTTKDGIAYTRDFDAKFLKTQKDSLFDERAKLVGQAVRLEDEANSLIEDGEMGDVQFDDESGEGDTMVVERERDLALSAQARQTVADIDDALDAHRQRNLRLLDALGSADPARAPGGDPVGHRAGRGEGRRDRPSMTPSVRTVRGPLVIAAVVVLVDQLTKHWALSALGDGHVVHVVGSLQLNLAFNSGMAFSRGDGLGPFVPVLAVGVIAALLIALGRSDSPWFAVGVGLVDRRLDRQRARPAVPRRGVAARSGGRLHRSAVVADLQRRRHGDRGRRRAADPEHASARH